MKKYIAKLVIITLFFLSCEKQDEYGPAPEIRYLGFTVLQGSGEYTVAEGVLKFSFVDGDGDIGFIENMADTLDDIPDIIVIEHYKENGAYHTKPKGPYLMPFIEPEGRLKSLKGTIELKIPRIKTSHDTVKYEFYIIDRAFHQSNIEITPEIIYSDLLKQ